MPQVERWGKVPSHNADAAITHQHAPCSPNRNYRNWEGAEEAPSSMPMEGEGEALASEEGTGLCHCPVALGTSPGPWEASVFSSIR